MSTLELDPWIVAVENRDGTTAALWQLQQNQSSTLAVFSNREAADRYAAANVVASARALQPSRIELVQIMIDCYRQGIRFAALDPDNTSARRIFDLREVLSSAKKELQSNPPPEPLL